MNGPDMNNADLRIPASGAPQRFDPVFCKGEILKDDYRSPPVILIMLDK
jgi:hypothetical protein